MITSPSQLFAERLKELSATKESYSQIARDLGINRQQFAKYIAGTSRPRDGLVQKMANYFEVDSAVFFQKETVSAAGKAEQGAVGSLARALTVGLEKLDEQVLSEADFPSGFYLVYKESFTNFGKIVCLFIYVYRDAEGVVHFKRRYSAPIRKGIPGTSAKNTASGVFLSNIGVLIMLERDGVIGDVTMAAFKRSSIYTLANRVHTGVVLTQGRPGAIGAMSGRIVLERVPEGDSPLAWARKQGFFDPTELPEYVQFHFENPERVPSRVMASR